MDVTVFDKANQFFPTPPDIVEKMLEGIDFSTVGDVLEPSAGKGNIAEILVSKIKMGQFRRCESDMSSVETIEFDSELRATLKGKGFKVIHDDFLTFRTYKHYDLIVMNPPFATGDAHLMKALDLIEDGGMVVCLLNAETIRRPCTNLRKVLAKRLRKLNAEYDFIGNAFAHAERPTDVDVVIVRVKAPYKEGKSFIFENLKKKSYEEVDFECSALVGGDFISQIVKQYEMEVEGGLRLIREYKAIRPYIRRDFSEKGSSDYTILELKLYNERGHFSLSENKYVEEVRLKYWDALFRNKEFTGRLTTNLQEELYSKVKMLKHYDFSAFNIREIQLEMMKMLHRGVEDAIMDLFEKLSVAHSWYPEMKGNIHYYNGWATNKAHKINKKVIIPIHGAFSSYSWSQDAFEANTVYKVMQDLEKSLCYLDTGSTYSGDDLWERILACKNAGKTKNIPLRYFNITLYKKGTCHITFTNEQLLEKLNIFGSQRKGWLPPCYGKARYSEMTDEEKTVVTEFHGSEEKYNSILADAGYYLTDAATPSLLSSPQ